MKKMTPPQLFFSAVLLLMTSALSGPFALANDSVTQFRPDCATDANDPFDPGLSLTHGPNHGKCLITSRSRSIVLLSPDQIRNYGLNPPAGWVSFANFFHGRKFWYANIDPNGVADVIFQIEDFPAIVPAAHTQIRIKMLPGSYVELVEQSRTPGKDPERLQLRDIALSIEAVEVAGEEYDVFRGLEDHFAIDYRFVSMAERYESNVLIDHHHARQYVLNLDSEEKKSVLMNALDMSNSRGITEFYNTLTKSCTTEAFHLLDQSIHYSSYRDIQKFLGSLILDQTYPPEGALGLDLRGLLYPRGKSRIADLEKDQELVDELIREGVYPKN